MVSVVRDVLIFVVIWEAIDIDEFERCITVSKKRQDRYQMEVDNFLVGNQNTEPYLRHTFQLCLIFPSLFSLLQRTLTDFYNKTVVLFHPNARQWPIYLHNQLVKHRKAIKMVFILFTRSSDDELMIYHRKGRSRMLRSWTRMSIHLSKETQTSRCTNVFACFIFVGSGRFTFTDNWGTSFV